MKIWFVFQLFYMLYHPISLFHIFNNMVSFYSNITIKINQIGYSKILGNNENLPDEVYINGIKQNFSLSHYDLKEPQNTIKLIWDNEIENCNGFFKDCPNITEIDLSNFNTSLVYQMNYMFQGCSSLTSINLANLNTSLVTLMNNMFDNCYSLLSLDLSFFNTSIVTKMEEMFYNCSSLTSLNLSNFNTSKNPSTKTMFSNCSKLEYLNLKNFTFLSDNSEIFKYTPENLIICVNESNTKELYSPINLNNCTIISCSDNWKEKRKKINLQNKTCVDSCENIGKLEKNGNCIEIPDKSCPKETPFILIDEQNCVEICSFIDIVDKNCILSQNLSVSEDILLNITLSYLKSNSFSNDIFKYYGYVTFKEKRVKFNLSKFTLDNFEPYNCQPPLNENNEYNNNFFY